MTCLELCSVTRIHGTGASEVRALSDVSLTLAAGEFVAVMGASGSGKSTLLHLAGGLDTPTSGEVFVAGKSLSSLNLTGRAKLRREKIGYVFQDFNLLPSLTAVENVAFPLELDRSTRLGARKAALSAMELLGVADLADRFPEDMSGGQAQRVAIARAIAGGRQLLLADEPTGALDSVTGESVIRVLRDCADVGVGVLLVTHEPRFAAWADRTVFLSDGRIVSEAQPGSVDDLLVAP